MLKRDVMKFLLPISVESIGRTDLTGRLILPMYISPQNIQIAEKKLVQKKLTNGGFSVQYWGEDLPVLIASGVTGSGGIEAINILRRIYRHEQVHFDNVVLDRLRQFAAEIESEASKSAEETNSSLLDTLGNAVTEGFETIIDIFNEGFNASAQVPGQVKLLPSPAAFATSIDIYFHGEKYRGYFTDFSMNEDAESPGIIKFSFSFTITRRWGRRTNYMPWHRNPRDSSGQPITASMPIEGAREDELSFPTNSTIESGIESNLSGVISAFDEISITPGVDADIVPLNRNQQVKS